MPRLIFLLALVTLPDLGCRPAPETIPHRLGQTEIAFVRHSTDSPLPAFLVLHGNERTAVEAGLETIRARGGRLVEIQAQGGRLIEIDLDGAKWRFDPNRIFTEKGREATLHAESGAAPPEVLAEVQRFSEAVLATYGVGSLPLVVTLHNNTAGEYSAASYAPGGIFEEAAAAVHLPAGADPDDFFFLTDRGHYDALLPEGFPLVLQDIERAEDDGSLSIWAGRLGIPYVNVEARHGNLEKQIAMLEALERAVGRQPAGTP